MPNPFSSLRCGNDQTTVLDRGYPARRIGIALGGSTRRPGKRPARRSSQARRNGRGADPEWRRGDECHRLYTWRTGPHPALVLFHGFPGNEQNLDLAQAARRAGFVVLTLHYRGSWGSPGAFSFANAAADGANAVDWLMVSAQRASYQIDPQQVSVAGQSMGAFGCAPPQHGQKSDRCCLSMPGTSAMNHLPG